METSDFDKYLKGECLYGDELSDEQIKEWFESEKLAYDSLATSNSSDYEYHELNKIFYRLLPNRKFENVLLIGGYYCQEILPIIGNLNNIYNIEPGISDNIICLKEKVIKIIPPLENYDIPFDDNYFDLIIALGVLHHMPKISHVIREIYRVSKYGGYCIIREPIVSMGDWRVNRKGLTKNERGIPLKYFRESLKFVGFDIKSEILYDFPLVRKIFKYPYRCKYITYLDLLLARVFNFNYRYHHTKKYHKLSPCSIGYVLSK